MLNLSVNNARRFLFLGAHSDDIEIGCGGTILSLAQRRPDIQVLWAVLSAEGPRAAEARRSARDYLAGFEGKTKVIVSKFRGSYFPDQWAGIKAQIEKLRREFEPEVVFTHFREDRHQDHRVLSDLAWNTFRNHLIFEYEIPKFDGDMGQPNVFHALSRSVMERKIELLIKHFGTQRSKHWFDRDTFAGLMRLRGMECVAPDGFAEAFHMRKLPITF